MNSVALSTFCSPLLCGVPTRLTAVSAATASAA
jgi:hypothetical protein